MLLDHATQLGVSVKFQNLGAMQGCYRHHEQVIEIDPALGDGMWAKSVLAHELGHAWWRHTKTTDETERQADEYAARLLIDPTEYEDAERISHNPMFIAQELGVTIRLVKAWQGLMMQVTA